MNFVAHLLVALEVQPGSADSDHAFGAVLPDLASMARVKVDRTQLTPEALSGMQLHHRTDDAFHGDPWFLELLGSGGRTLLDSSVPRGGSRACAHLGVELLLDGVLLENAAVGRRTDELFAALPTKCAASDEDEQWPAFLNRAAEYGRPDWYDDPAQIAGFLQRIVARRKRLAFDVEHVPAVEKWLTAVRPSIVSSADELLARVTSKVVTAP